VFPIDFGIRLLVGCCFCKSVCYSTFGGDLVGCFLLG
jgi:hypothetical protein